MKKLSLILVLLTGCATQANTAYQSVTVSTLETVNQDQTLCSLKNEEGEWKSTINTPISIHRDGNPMTVNCENNVAKGTTTVEPKFNGEYLAMDIILVDLCLVSCIVDGSNNAFYEYPSIINVPMLKK
jgi:hypothetical protein